MKKALVALIKLNVRHLVKEKTDRVYDQFSHPAFRRKLDKDATLSDFSISEKLVELEYKSGERYWLEFELFFGKVICNATEILMLHEDEITEGLHIHSVAVEKVKRTNYLKLIFERDLPF